MAGSPEWMMLARAVLAFLFVVGLIFLSGALVRKFGLDKRIVGNKGPSRLAVAETLYLDPRHRVVLVRCGDREHLLLLGAAGNLLIESRQAEVADGK